MPSEKKQGVAAKTEIVTLRLDPKKRFALELLARKQYRSISSVIEWMIDLSINNDDGISAFDEIWDVDEADRLVNLAFFEPNLLNYEEQKAWKIIRECGHFWKGSHNKIGYWVWNISISNVVMDRVRIYYKTILDIVNGEANIEELPKTTFKPPEVATEKKPNQNFDLDDEIPF